MFDMEGAIQTLQGKVLPWRCQDGIVPYRRANNIQPIEKPLLPNVSERYSYQLSIYLAMW